MPNKQQIKLIQTAARSAGLRVGADEGRYRLLLRQYTDPKGRSITSCKDLSNAQIDDFLAICEAMGFRYPGKSETWCRDKVYKNAHCASIAQQQSLRYLAEDLGWNIDQLAGMIARATAGRTDSLVMITPTEAHNLIEALKNMLGRKTGKKYQTLKDVQIDMEVVADGKVNKTSKTG